LTRVFTVYLKRTDLVMLKGPPGDDTSTPNRVWVLLPLPGELGPGFANYEIASRHDYSGVAMIELRRRARS
jgi:hypothetical protein